MRRAETLICVCLPPEVLKLFLESPTPSPSIVQTQEGTSLSEEGWSDLNTPGICGLWADLYPGRTAELK